MTKQLRSVTHIFGKLQFNNLKSENAKATKKRHTNSWLITLESDQSLLAEQEAPSPSLFRTSS